MERENVLIPQADLDRQRGFEEKIKGMFAARQAHPVACVDTFGCQQNVADGQKLMGMLAACGFTFTEDPSYVNIYGGRWLTGNADKNGDPPAYAAIHRMAVDPALRGQGTAGKLFACVFSLAKKEGMGSIRIDTHEGNLPMQRALVKAGFTRCGTIRLCGGDEDGDPRIAFEKLL